MLPLEWVSSEETGIHFCDSHSALLTTAPSLREFTWGPFTLLRISDHFYDSLRKEVMKFLCLLKLWLSYQISTLRLIHLLAQEWKKTFIICALFWEQAEAILIPQGRRIIMVTTIHRAWGSSGSIAAMSMPSLVLYGPEVSLPDLSTGVSPHLAPWPLEVSRIITVTLFQNRFHQRFKHRS